MSQDRKLDYFSGVQKFVLGGREYGLGEELPYWRFPERRWDRLIRIGEVIVRPVAEGEKRLDEEAEVNTSEESDSASLDDLSRNDLLALAEEKYGILEGDIEGSGKGGYVTKQDLVGAVSSAGS